MWPDLFSSSATSVGRKNFVLPFSVLHVNCLKRSVLIKFSAVGVVTGL